jgi:hypothetical protein
MEPARERPSEPAETVPIFGRWRAIYSAVAVCALVVMVLIAVFSVWPY